jgi:3-hydroxyacyl-CoA dehydrogenase
VDLGLDPYKIDMAILAGFGMPMGPFRRVCSLSA